jgi:hypothetical protein
LKKPVFPDAPKEVRYFQENIISDWLPERYLEHGYSELSDFFVGLQWIKQASYVPRVLYDFCFYLDQYYESETGQQTLELIHKAHTASKAQEGFHPAMDTAPFKAVDKQSARTNRRFNSR